MRRRFISMLLSCLMLTSCASAEEGSLTLIALNVGKGDCLLLASGETMYMIDAALPKLGHGVLCAAADGCKKAGRRDHYPHG